MSEKTYKEATEYIESIPMFGPKINGRSKSGNENLIKVLDGLGNPEKKIKSIHIAGTNGKGSTALFITNLLCSKGYRVGLFTSPHLIRINERISIHEPRYDGGEFKIISEDISDEEFAKCCFEVKSRVDAAVAAGALHLSYFEYLFAMATVYFEKSKPDYAVYETGLGGRLDATNVLMPEITAITSIGLDHTKYLGNTIRDIAWEKAGIIKNGVPVIYNTGETEADMVIETQAELMGAEAINVAKTEYIINEFTDKTIDFSVHNRYYKYSSLKLFGGVGLYQADNALTAIETVNTLFKGEAMDTETIQRSFDMFSWQGRMEKISPGIILDGAHNPDAIDRFVESVNGQYAGRDRIILFAVAGDKDYEPMIKQLCEGVRPCGVYVTALDSDRGISSEYVAGLFRMYLAGLPGGRDVSVCFDDDIQKAFLDGAASVRGTDKVLLCVGSLYLIGSIKRIASEVLHYD